MKIDPKPKLTPAVDPTSERFWDPRDLEAEARRVFEICHNCRMCVNYCGSFPDLFARVDRDIERRGAQGAELLDAADFRSVTDLCFQCKLCYIKCPYTKDEQHEWLVDVPRLLGREKAQRTRREGLSLQDAILGEPQALGRLNAGPQAGLVNLVNANRLVRKVGEAVAGISSQFPLPPFGKVSFARWLARHEPLEGAGKAGTVALFATCLGDYNFPIVAANAVRVLEKNGFDVVRPEQTCCGMPNLDGGDMAAAQEKARLNIASLLPHVERGRAIVVTQPTCAYAMKKEWPEILGGSDDARRVAAATLDLMELLDKLRKEKALSRDFKKGFGKVAYHAPCHLRAQKIGFPAARIFNLLPDTEAEVIEACSAVDGTWGMKAQYYELGRRYAERLTRTIGDSEADVVVTDCSLAARRIEQENGRAPLHPAVAMAIAYGVKVEV